MGKKKNKKFKQTKLTISIPSKPAEIITQAEISERAPESGINDISTEVAKKDELTVLDERYTYVRKDIMKLLIVIGILIALLVGAYFVGAKTTLLTTLGSWIYRVCNFNI